MVAGHSVTENVRRSAVGVLAFLALIIGFAAPVVAAVPRPNAALNSTDAVSYTHLEVMGKPVSLTSSRNRSLAARPELITPPPV